MQLLLKGAPPGVARCRACDTLDQPPAAAVPLKKLVRRFVGLEERPAAAPPLPPAAEGTATAQPTSLLQRLVSWAADDVTKDAAPPASPEAAKPASRKAAAALKAAAANAEAEAEALKAAAAAEAEAAERQEAEAALRYANPLSSVCLAPPALIATAAARPRRALAPSPCTPTAPPQSSADLRRECR